MGAAKPGDARISGLRHAYERIQQRLNNGEVQNADA
jgi:hypothetical protein